MNWHLPISLIALLALTFRASAADPVPENMQLFLLIGQSNMAGRGKVEAQDKQTHPRIFMLNKEQQWVPARDPLHFDKGAAGVGLGSEFARVIAKTEPQATIGLIPCAFGGTSLEQWKAGGKLYQDAVERTKVAQKSGKLVGLLWHQGEADSSPEKVATYGDRFATMIAQLRKDLDAAEVPLIIGELGRFRAASTDFNAALPAIAAKVPRCAMVTAEDLTDNKDKLHFDSASLRTLGQRYAAAYLKLKGK